MIRKRVPPIVNDGDSSKEHEDVQQRRKGTHLEAKTPQRHAVQRISRRPTYAEASEDEEYDETLENLISMYIQEYPTLHMQGIHTR